MKQPNPIRNPFQGAYITPWNIGVTSLKELKKVHAWLGRTIAWLEDQQAKRVKHDVI